MKKSQVLAALALAMALGVAAPVASTFAATSAQSDCQKVLDEVYDKLTELGDQDSTAALSDLSTAFAALKEAYSPKAATLRVDLNAFLADGTTTIANTKSDYAVWQIAAYVLINGGTVSGRAVTVNDFLNKNYDEVVAFTKGVRFTKTDVAEGLDKTIIPMTDKAMAAYITPVEAGLETLDLSTNLKNGATAGEVVAYVNGLGNLTKTLALYDVYNNNYVCGSTDEEVLAKGTAALKAGLAAFNGTTTPDGSGNAQKPVAPSTPDTGANTASEESATASVSILSGVASVVTAAGVVIRKAFRK